MGVPRRPAEPPTAEQAAFLERAIQEYGQGHVQRFAYPPDPERGRRAGPDPGRVHSRLPRAWRSFQPGTSFLSWIYRIVTNLYRDELRRRKGRFHEEIPEDNAPQEFGGQRPLAVSPIEDYVEGQLSESLSRSLGLLSAEQRQVVILADIEEYSYQEISDIMGCSIGTVRSRLHRARALLRRLIQRTQQT